MPYVTQERRQQLLDGTDLQKPGDLEYLFAYLVNDYIVTRGLSHQTITDIRGALIGAKDEFNRRVAFPYENGKLSENGDVYTR